MVLCFWGETVVRLFLGLHLSGEKIPKKNRIIMRGKSKNRFEAAVLGTHAAGRANGQNNRSGPLLENVKRLEPSSLWTMNHVIAGTTRSCSKTSRSPLRSTRNTGLLDSYPETCHGNRLYFLAFAGSVRDCGRRWNCARVVQWREEGCQGLQHWVGRPVCSSVLPCLCVVAFSEARGG